MNGRRQLLLLIVFTGILAGGLRFWRLGAWPFGGDELSTFRETEALFEPSAAPETSQISRLPRLTPLSHLVHRAAYVCFGQDEFGSRVMMALFGTLHCMLVLVLLDGLIGRRAAFATALLLAVWPEHVYYSQYNRFYITAALLVSLALLAGAWGLRNRLRGLTVLACLLAFASILSFTLAGLVFVGLLGGLLLGARVAARPSPWASIGIVFLAAILALGFGMLYVLPLTRGWNSTASWGASPLHSLLASLSQVGWPIILLAALGAVLGLTERSEQGGYWVVCGLLWVLASLALPLLVVYHSAYHFPLTLGAFVLAGLATGKLAELLARQGPRLEFLWYAVVAALSLPGLLSHYRDGSRIDYRTAANYVAKHWQPGDKVAALAPSTFRYYTRGFDEAEGLSASRPVADLESLRAGGERLWVVLSCGRYGHPEELQDWLRRNSRQELVIRKQRFDHRDYVSEVYLCAADGARALEWHAARDQGDGDRQGGE